MLTSRPSAPWYLIEIAAAKTKRRKLEMCWRKSQLHIDRQLFEDQCELVRVMVKQSKTRYYSCIISENASDQKALFNTVDRLLYRKTERKYLSCDSTLELCNNFSDFFVNKIAKIRTELPTFTTDDSALSFTIQLDIPRFNTALDSFIPTTETEVRGLICKTAKKSCCLGPIPASLLVQCFDDLLPVITRIINLAFASSTVPTSLKQAVLSPLQKKPLLDHELYPNLYRMIFFAPLMTIAVFSFYYLTCLPLLIPWTIRFYLKGCTPALTSGAQHLHGSTHISRIALSLSALKEPPLAYMN